MSSLSSTKLQATLDTSPVTIWDISVPGTKNWGPTYFKNTSASGGDVYLTITGLPSGSKQLVLNPGDIIGFRLGGGITKVVAVAASTATLNYGPQTDGRRLPVAPADGSENY